MIMNSLVALNIPKLTISTQISVQKNFKNATIVNTTAKKQSSKTSTVDRRNVSPKEVTIRFRGGAIFSSLD